MRVVDASAVLEVLLARQGADPLIDQLIDHPPAILAHGTEQAVVMVLRHYRREGQISDARARQALAWLAEWLEASAPRPDFGHLAPRVWELSQRLEVETATALAVAEHLGAPLLTCDPALESSVDRQIEIFYFGS